MLPYSAFLIDLDGVIYRGNELLPGAKDFISWLESDHKKYLFLTNNSFATGAHTLTKLEHLGIATDDDTANSRSSRSTKHRPPHTPRSGICRGRTAPYGPR